MKDATGLSNHARRLETLRGLKPFGFIHFTAGASLARFYWENAQFLGDMAFDPIPLPAGVSVFPKEGPRLSRRWAEKRFADLRFFNEPDKGGHFAAMENPEAFANDVADTFAAMR